METVTEIELVAPREPIAGLTISHLKGTRVLPGVFLTADLS